MSPWNFFKSYGNPIFVRQIVTNHTFIFYLIFAILSGDKKKLNYMLEIFNSKFKIL